MHVFLVEEGEKKLQWLRILVECEMWTNASVTCFLMRQGLKETCHTFSSHLAFCLCLLNYKSLCFHCWNIGLITLCLIIINKIGAEIKVLPYIYQVDLVFFRLKDDHKPEFLHKVSVLLHSDTLQGIKVSCSVLVRHSQSHAGQVSWCF